MNNAIITYLSNIFTKTGLPTEEVQSYAEQMFLITLSDAISEVATPDEISRLETLIQSKDEEGVNSFLLSLPSNKLQPIFIVKLQDNLKSFFESIMKELDENEKADFVKKLEQIANTESLSQYKDMNPEEFLKSISK